MYGRRETTYDRQRQQRRFEEELQGLSQEELLKVISRLMTDVSELKSIVYDLREENNILFDRGERLVNLKKISELLTEIGIPDSKGRKYLIEGIRYCIKKPEKISIVKELYPYLAKDFYISIEILRNEMKKAIRKAVQQRKPKLRAIESFFPKDLRKLNNADFIYGVINYMKNTGD